MTGKGVLIVRLFYEVNKGHVEGHVSCFTHVTSCFSRLRQARSDGQRESLRCAAACLSPQYGQNVGDPPG